MIRSLLKVFVFVISFVNLTSCSKIEFSDFMTEETSQTVDVTVSLTGIDFTILPQTRSIVSEAGITRIALKVFDSSGKSVADTCQIASKVGDGFNKLGVQLPAGTYTFVAIAHDATADNIGCATIESSQVVTLPEGIIPTVYSHVEEKVTIANSNNQSVVINMGKRINATLRLTSSDIVPDEVARMTVDINHDGVTLSVTNLPQINPSTGFSLENYRFARVFPITEGDLIDVSMNLLLPANEYSFPAVIQAQNGSNKTITCYTRSFDGVPFQRAYVTNASGQYFRYVNSTSMTFDTTQGTLPFEY